MPAGGCGWDLSVAPSFQIEFNDGCDAGTFPLDVGMSLKIPLHDSKKSYPLQVEVVKRETVETKMGVFHCLVLEPKLKSRGLFKSEGRMQIFLSDDERRLPVMLKARAPVGSFSSQMVSYERGRPLADEHRLPR